MSKLRGSNSRERIVDIRIRPEQCEDRRENGGSTFDIEKKNYKVVFCHYGHNSHP